MTKITEEQLTGLADLFDESKKQEFTFQGYKIVVEQLGNDYDYEILFQDRCKYNWHMAHWDHGFSSEEEARKAAERWIENYDESEDEYYAQ